MTNLLRSVLGPRVVRPLVITAASTALLCGAFAVGGRLRQPAIVVSMPAVAVPAPRVTVAPATIVLPSIVPVRVVLPEEPVADEAERAPPRALAPRLEPTCLIPEEERPDHSICNWDEGFPAISADGRLIATKYSRSGGDDTAGLSIHLIDTRTSRLVHDIRIVELDELSAIVYPAEGVSPDKQAEARRRLQHKIDRRVAAVQRRLDAGRFRSLALLGSVDGPEQASEPGPGPIHAEIVGTKARLIDSTSSSVLGQADFAVPDPHPTDDDVSECAGWSWNNMTVWWDPTTHHLLGIPVYMTGGCMCDPMDVVEVVRRLR